MLTYAPQFCKVFSASAPPAWQGPWAAWRPWSGSCAGGGPLAHAPGRSVLASMPVPPPLHATWTAQRRTPLCTHGGPHRRSTCVMSTVHTRPHQPDIPARAVMCLGAPACSGGHVMEQRGCVPALGCVPTGEIPVYLREKSPCTYGRNPRVPTGEAPVYLREKKHALTLYF